MRILQYLIAAAMIVSGLLFAALNDAAVTIDLYFATVPASVGAALLVALLLGFLLAGLVLWLLVIWPQRRQLANARRALASPSLPARSEPVER